MKDCVLATKTHTLCKAISPVEVSRKSLFFLYYVGILVNLTTHLGQMSATISRRKYRHLSEAWSKCDF